MRFSQHHYLNERNKIFRNIKKYRNYPQRVPMRYRWWQVITPAGAITCHQKKIVNLKILLKNAFLWNVVLIILRPSDKVWSKKIYFYLDYFGFTFFRILTVTFINKLYVVINKTKFFSFFKLVKIKRVDAANVLMWLNRLISTQTYPYRII